MPDESYIQGLLAERIGGRRFGKETQIYKFERIKRAKAAALKAHPGKELLDLGVGEPDEMAAPGVVEVMQKETARSENRGYADNGIPEFKEAAARYMERVFGVSGIDPGREVVHSIGTKPALAMLATVLINPGDLLLMTTPGYPVLATHTRYYGGEVVELPLREERGYLPDLDALSEEVRRRAKVLYLNYPNNPTGGTATPEFFERVVRFARQYQVAVVHDAAYAALAFDGKPLSFLSVPGAKEVGVELHSLSKAFNMTGWRLGFVTGNPLLVSAYAHVKDHVDSGQFKAIQQAGLYALNHPEITRETAAKYERRLRALAAIFREVGFRAEAPRGGFFLYTAIPKGIKGGRRFSSAEEFSEHLITELLLSTVPWDDVGHYIRLSATFVAPTREEEERVLGEVKRRLSGVRFAF